MKLQSTTIALLLLALGLGGVVYFSEVRSDRPNGEQQAEGQRIFNFEENQVQAFALKTGEQTLEFVKNESATPAQASPSASPSPDSKQPADKAPKPISKWQMKAPTDNPADEASVAYLLNLLATGRSDRTLKVPSTQMSDFGLDQPTATIEVKLNNQKTHRLVLGKPDFNGSFLYAQADPPTSASPELSVLLVSPDFGNAVNRPLSEWKAQPPTSEQPQNSPDAQPSVTPEGSATPSPDAPPSPTPTSSDAPASPTTESSENSPATEPPQ